MSYKLNAKLNKLVQKINYDIAMHGYFCNKRDLVKFLKLSKYFSINHSPNTKFAKNILIRKFNSHFKKSSFSQNNNIIALSKNDYIPEFSKSNNNNIKPDFFYSFKKISSSHKKPKKQHSNETKYKFKKIYNLKSDDRYNEVFERNNNIIMWNVKKFLNINSIDDENKILNFPYIKYNKNEKKEMIKSPVTYGTSSQFQRMKTINNSDQKEKTENSFINNRDISHKNVKKSFKIINNKNNGIINKKNKINKRNSTPNLRNSIRDINKKMVNTSANKFINIQKDLIDLTFKILQTPLLISPSKKDYIFNYYVNKTYRKQIPLYMKHRLNWNLVTNKEEGYSLRWKYYPGRVNYKLYQYFPNMPIEKIKMISVFENYKQIGNKENFFINFIKYCNRNKINPFKYIPFTIVLNRTFMYEKSLKNLEKIDYLINNDYESLNNEKILYTKLFSLTKMSGISDKDFEDLFIYIDPKFISEYNYWIVKPPGLFQGMGIKVFKDFKEIKSHCQMIFNGIEKVTAEQEEYCKKNNLELKPKIYRSDYIVIQKYLDNPLLYYGRKFDIRCYVLVDYCFNVFMCREGHLKACSQNYDLKDLNIFTHITNYSLQKRCKDFAKYEQGNEISFKKFIELLDNTNIIKGRGKKIFNKIYSKMKEEIQLSMNCIGRKLKGIPKVLSFQIFGYDFIIDKEYNPWILEINDNPGLEISSELISHLIPRMIDDALRLTIDKVFPTEYDKEVLSQDGKKYKSKYHLDGFNDEENLFEFICNIEHSKYDKDLNKKNENNKNNNNNNNNNFNKTRKESGGEKQKK